MNAAGAHPVLARVARALAMRTPRLAERDEPFREAAVALILRPGPADGGALELLLIRRAVRAGDPWSGQIGLPGGGASPGDGSLEATALRETIEEVGLDFRAYGQVLGALDELRPRTPALPPIVVRPYVVAVESPPPLVLSDEVADYRWVSLDALFAPETRVETSVEVRDLRLRVPAFLVGDYTVWGMTERILTTFEGIWR